MLALRARRRQDFAEHARHLCRTRAALAARETPTLTLAAPTRARRARAPDRSAASSLEFSLAILTEELCLLIRLALLKSRRALRLGGGSGDRAPHDALRPRHQPSSSAPGRARGADRRCLAAATHATCLLGLVRLLVRPDQMPGTFAKVCMADTTDLLSDDEDEERKPGTVTVEDASARSRRAPRRRATHHAATSFRRARGRHVGPRGRHVGVKSPHGRARVVVCPEHLSSPIHRSIHRG